MIVAGFGFRAAATAESLADALERSGGMGKVAVLATARDKAQAGAFCGLARSLGLPIRAVDAEIISRQETATRSSASLAARGTASMAEAAALAAAGQGAQLVAPRVISGDGMATCALAKGKGT
ncbi:MAG: cobalamin biosynthesis protein [Pseudomonadota bacterium]